MNFDLCWNRFFSWNSRLILCRWYVFGCDLRWDSFSTLNWCLIRNLCSWRNSILSLNSRKIFKWLAVKRPTGTHGPRIHNENDASPRPKLPASLYRGSPRCCGLKFNFWLCRNCRNCSLNDITLFIARMTCDCILLRYSFLCCNCSLKWNGRLVFPRNSCCNSLCTLCFGITNRAICKFRILGTTRIGRSAASATRHQDDRQHCTQSAEFFDREIR